MIKVKNFFKSNLFVVSFVGIFLAFLLSFYSSEHRSKNKGPSIKNHSKEIGISIGGVDQQAYIARLEKNYYDFEDRVKEVEKKVEHMQSTSDRLTNSQKEIAEAILRLDQNLGIKIQQKLDEFKGALNFSEESKDSSSEELELSVANVNTHQDWVYLPIGSFCKGTLLTGVYAAADVNNPLPVLISLDEAFYGPNKSRIPLKGAFVLGKAYGDLVSERALIQIVAVSTVLPNGHAFENEQDLGYVTDEFGELGIKGKVIYNTGRQLAMSFMGGFVAGGAQAMADSEVTTHQTVRGDTAKTVTGSGAKNSLFSGVAQSAGKLAQFYEKQADDLVPAVHIKNGATVYFIVQKGVTIHGLVASDFDYRHFMD